MQRTNGQREYLGLPLCGRESEQVVTRTGDTDGNRAAAKAAAMHARNSAECDRKAARHAEKMAAKAEKAARRAAA